MDLRHVSFLGLLYVGVYVIKKPFRFFLDLLIFFNIVVFIIVVFITVIEKCIPFSLAAVFFVIIVDVDVAIAWMIWRPSVVGIMNIGAFCISAVLIEPALLTALTPVDNSFTPTWMNSSTTAICTSIIEMAYLSHSAEILHSLIL